MNAVKRRTYRRGAGEAGGDAEDASGEGAGDVAEGTKDVEDLMPASKTYRFGEIRRPYGMVVGIGLLTAVVVVLFELVNMAVLYRHVRLDLYLCLVAVFFLGAGALLTRRRIGKQTHEEDVPVPAETVAPEPPVSGLIELLSAKEWQILKLVAEGKTNKEIAAVQFVEVSTVKTHLNNIYGKLSVSNRKEARAKYAELAPSWPIIG